MCGIWLLLLKNSTDDIKKIMNLKDIFDSFMKTSNRGPDRSTLEILDKPNNVLVGFHRLSIMDPSTKGDQPFKLEIKDGRTIWTICNGEIYNYKFLIDKYNLTLSSGSDCEILPHLYNKIGIDNMCKELEGEYAFIILDINMKTGKGDLFACRDRFGIRPMFYSNNGKYFNFSSELKSITDKENVQVFPPRNYMHLSNINNSSWQFIGLKNYYDFDMHKHTTKFLTIDNTGLEVIKDKVRETFIKSVETKMVSDRPLGCLLSGGLDSSLVASIASKYLNKFGRKLRTFSIGMDGSTDEYYAKLVAKHINSDHTHIEFTENDFINALRDVICTTETYDITTVRASTGQYLVSKWISENTDIKVLLIGDGSDELAAGYMYFHKAPTPSELHLENVRLLEDIHFYDVLRADRGIAENGIEARVPFLDHNFVDLYLSIDPYLRHPNSYKDFKNYALEKWLLRESFNIDEYLPNEVLFRKKEAFSDGVSSMKKSWYQIVQEYANNLYDDSFFEEEKDRIQFNKPPSKEALYFRKIWEEYYGINIRTSLVIPYFWLPKWCGDIKEPSARVLEVYNE
jgi:asparagine synthase (glutamine-hydrolysing)